ncbi:NADPH:quinone reductase-like Zn-dependent oxidoreductase [Stackebrandtia endophytica]|uniref:NADPH:quinone reductase-like Zn-dependent oxidoreductase n=1 Tax=Stackebrandtia endophytica TaxID=1496996 RepID=A0A543AYH8_9ACTN|nr:NADP-dependent oxidoreductase [Stackebrandtia endophytica]TQL77631.1 NADPH:quinone reductase-like Zn-dependent oxidoreductase [Stackebrandtia endophytica]
MKAMRYHSHGDSDVLVYEEVDEPTPDAGQVVIRVAGTAFNLLDVAMRIGIVRETMPVRLPHTPNIDVSGVITEVGDGVTGWNVGDEVLALLPPTSPGAAAEYVAAPAAVLARAPRTIALADAAALPVAGLTAWQALSQQANLTAGQTILINGAGGGVGGYAVQLAKRAGAVVTATAGPRSFDRVRAAGADHIVDYTTSPVLEALAGQRFDVVLHLVRNSPEETAALVDLVADGGTFVTATTAGPDDPPRRVRTKAVFARGDAADLARLVSHVDTGELKVEVAERLPLTELAAVHDRAVAGQLPGKVVLSP